MKTKLQFSIFLLALFIYFYNKANAQTADWIWAKAMGGTADDYGLSIAVDPNGSGDVFTAGYFSGTVDFDLGAGLFNITATGSSDIFISRSDGSGNFIWAKQLGGNNFAEAYSIAVDMAGNVYTTGRFFGTVDFDPDSSANFNLTSVGTSYDMFISKLDASGNFIWAKAITGTSDVVGYSIAIDTAGSGDVCTTGLFLGTVDFDPGAGVFSLTDTGNYDIFISKLDSSGNFVWAKRMGGIIYDYGYSLAIDPAGSGDVYITGAFQLTADFDPGAGMYNLTTAGAGDIFVAKLTGAGTFVWAKQMGGTNADAGTSIALDPSGNGNIFTTGIFQGIADFNPGTSDFNLTSAGISDIFISKLSSSGQFVWAKAMGGGDSDSGNSIAIDPDGSGDIYTTGNFSGIADFDPGTGILNLTSYGNADIFISKLDLEGNFSWVKAMGGTGFEQGFSIALNPAGGGDVYVAGNFYSPSISFGSTTITNADGNGTTLDIFIAKLGIATGITDEVNSNGVSVFPNPANNILNIGFPLIENKKVWIRIMDMKEQLIYATTETRMEKLEVNTKNFEDGIYFVQVHGADFFETKKVIVIK